MKARRDVAGLGKCTFWVYAYTDAIKVKSPYWETTFYKHGDGDWSDNKTGEAPRMEPQIGLCLELEELLEEKRRHQNKDR